MVTRVTNYLWHILPTQNIRRTLALVWRAVHIIYYRWIQNFTNPHQYITNGLKFHQSTSYITNGFKFHQSTSYITRSCKFHQSTPIHYKWHQISAIHIIYYKVIQISPIHIHQTRFFLALRTLIVSWWSLRKYGVLSFAKSWGLYGMSNDEFRQIGCIPPPQRHFQPQLSFFFQA